MKILFGGWISIALKVYKCEKNWFCRFEDWLYKEHKMIVEIFTS